MNSGSDPVEPAGMTALVKLREVVCGESEMSREDFSRSLVTGLADALNDHNLTRARTYLADDLHFVGVFGPPIEGADAYLEAMRRLGARQTVLKCLAEANEVACFYQLSLPARPEVSLFGCGWFTISDGRIGTIRIVLDPTPLGKT